MMNISNNNNNTNTTREAGTDSNISSGTSMSDNCKDGSSTKSSNDSVCTDVNHKLKNMSTADDKDIIVSVCANCGKEGSDINNICNKCKKATYCNAACKKKHRHKHKELCRKRAAELHDEELFKQPPPAYGDCPICFLRMPSLRTGRRYQSCCGKRICSGCIHAPVYDNQGNKVDEKKCPFCRSPHPDTNEEAIEREKKRLEADDAVAIYNRGNYYRDGKYGYPQNYTKALELWHRAAELGYSTAYCSIGSVYQSGRGVEIDEKKAKRYYELGAIGGDEIARHSLGLNEARANNKDRALKHWMIAVRDGYADSLDCIKRLYSHGYATKKDYTKALQEYQVYLGEIKSDQRDKAAAEFDQYLYY